MKIVISESQYKRLVETSNPKNINEGGLTTLLIGGIAALGLLGTKAFLKVFLNVFIDSAINGFFGYIDDIKNIVAPEPYIKFLKRLEKSEKFNSEFLKFVEESQNDGRLDGSPFWIENVTKLPSFIELFDEFTEKENIGEFEKNQLLILIRKSIIKSYARNGRKIVEALKKKMSNNQNEGLIESEEEQKVLRIPSLKFFGQNPLVGWKNLRKFLESKGNPPYSIKGDMNLSDFRINSVGNLQSVSGSLYLKNTPLESLGNLQSVGGYLDISSSSITSLGDLQSVGEHFFLRDTPLESFGNLTYVGGSLILENTPLSKMYSEEEIREMINVGGRVLL